MTCNRADIPAIRSPLAKKVASAFFDASRFAAIVAACSISLATAAHASATCTCVLSTDDIAGNTHTQGFNTDLSGQINATYTGWDQQGETNQVDCSHLCRAQAETAKGQPSTAAPFCSAGFNMFQSVAAFSKVGTKQFRLSTNAASQSMILHLVNNPPVRYCPAQWLSNTSNIPGGQTSDGRCKKLAGMISPYPATQTAIGTWGFTWSNSVWAYGDSINGGAPSTSNPGSCSWWP